MKQLVFISHVLLSKLMHQFLNLHRANYSEECLMVASINSKDCKVYWLWWLIALISDNALIGMWGIFTMHVICFINQSWSVHIQVVFVLCGVQITSFTDQEILIWTILIN